MKIKVVIITGPTATGKSDFAVQYALKNNGEVISADSRQIYKGMNLGTGKITKFEMKGVKHHLLDIVKPNQQFNVAKFKKLAQKTIEEISNRGKLPIICGGTGFYIDAVINNTVYPNVPHNKKLRDELKDLTAEQLFLILQKLDENYVKKLNNSEKNNKQRLIRSIEIAKKLGLVPKVQKEKTLYSTKWIGLNYPYEILKKRIHERLIRRIYLGMIEEVKKLHDEGLSWEKLDSFGLEYRYVSKYLQGKLSKDEMIKLLDTEICHYAKRQMVWFKKNKKIEWILKN